MRKLGKRLSQVERSVEAYSSCGCGCGCYESPAYSYGGYMSEYYARLEHDSR